MRAFLRDNALSLAFGALFLGTPSRADGLEVEDLEDGAMLVTHLDHGAGNRNEMCRR